MRKYYLKHILSGLLLFLTLRVMILSNDLLTAIILGLLAISVMMTKDNE